MVAEAPMVSMVRAKVLVALVKRKVRAAKRKASFFMAVSGSNWYGNNYSGFVGGVSSRCVLEWYNLGMRNIEELDYIDLPENMAKNADWQTEENRATWEQIPDEETDLSENMVKGDDWETVEAESGWQQAPTDQWYEDDVGVISRLEGDVFWRKDVEVDSGTQELTIYERRRRVFVIERKGNDLVMKPHDSRKHGFVKDAPKLETKPNDANDEIVEDSEGGVRIDQIENALKEKASKPVKFPTHQRVEIKNK